MQKLTNVPAVAAIDTGDENTFYTVDFGVNYSTNKFSDEDVISIIRDSYYAGVGKVVYFQLYERSEE